jgi:plasmid stability protein
MPTITVRGLDDEVVSALKVRAARAGRSMEAEVRSILVGAVRRSPSGSGFGSALAAVFSGVEAPEIPARTEFPEPLR